MVVLAATICNKAGKAVVSRQFIEMSRSRIESLVSAFPKLISNLGNSEQHTFVEVDTVRYVYQPLDESIYLVLITNKHSNILRDIDTLQLFSRVVADVCRVVDEREVSRNAFQLISVFDEIVALGYKENVNLGQIRTIIQMESQEERIQAEIERNKIKEVRDEMRQKQKMFEAMKKSESARRPDGFGGASGGSFGGSGYKPVSSNFTQKATSNGFSGSTATPSSVAQPTAHAPVSRGMQLGKKPGAGSELAAVLAVDQPVGAPIAKPALSVSNANNDSIALLSSGAPVHLAVQEKASLKIGRDGGIQNFEVKGELFLRVLDPAKACLKLNLAINNDPSVQYKTHPNVDRQVFADQHVIALKNPSHPFPVNQMLAVLKWRFSTQDESKLPLLLSCWPSPNPNNTCNVTIEFERPNPNVDLGHVTITIPIPGNSPPSVGNVTGSYKVDPSTRSLVWLLEKVDGNNDSGTLEFAINSQSADEIFPISIDYHSRKLLCPLTIKDCLSPSGEQVEYSSDFSSTPEVYQII